LNFFKVGNFKNEFHRTLTGPRGESTVSSQSSYIDYPSIAPTPQMYTSSRNPNNGSFFTPLELVSTETTLYNRSHKGSEPSSACLHDNEVELKSRLVPAASNVKSLEKDGGEVLTMRTRQFVRSESANDPKVYTHTFNNDQPVYGPPPLKYHSRFEVFFFFFFRNTFFNCKE
jgi:hypothetical protein